VPGVSTKESKELTKARRRIRELEAEHANAVAQFINNQRRRSFGYRSPAQIYAGLNVR
jgi:IS30 family transposase